MVASVYHLSLLGVPQLHRGDTLVSVSRRKALALLAYLAITQKVCSRDELAALFWPDYNSHKARTSLRTILPSLKKVLGPHDLITNRKTVQLRPGALLNIDVVQFRHALQQCQTHGHGEAAVCDDCLEPLITAVALYQGDFMSGFTLADCPEFEEWQLWQSQKLHLELVDGLERLIRCQRQLGLEKKAMATAHRLIIIDPYHETAHHHLLHLLAAAGQRPAALQLYEQFADTLTTELGTEPSVRLKQLYQQLRHDPIQTNGPQLFDEVQTAAALAAPPSFSLPTEVVPEPSPQMPAQSRMIFRRNPLFVGREAELQQVAHILNGEAGAASPPIALIVGMGGMGKTQLAIEFAYRYGRYFSGGVYWLNFDTADNIPAEVAACGAMLNLPGFTQQTVSEQVQWVKNSWQVATPRLLIFDNCEEEALLTQWLPRIGGCRIIVTSRRQIWPPHLATAALSLPLMQRHHSIEILTKLHPQIAAESAASIAHELGDLPLALHLAGGFLATYGHLISSEMYLSQLNGQSHIEHPSLQGRGQTQLPTGHSTSVARTMALSVERLDLEQEIDWLAWQLLARASFFSQGDPISHRLLAATMPGDAAHLMHSLALADAIQRLLALGLLEMRGEKLYVLHRLLAEFVQAHLHTRPHQERAAAQTDVETLLLQELEAINRSKERTSLEDLFPHIAYVVEQTKEQADPLATNLMAAWGYYLANTGNTQDALPYLQIALSRYHQWSPVPHKHLATMFTTIGYTKFELGLYDEAEADLQKGMALHREIWGQQDLRVADGLNNLGMLYTRMGHYQKALACLIEAISIQQIHLAEKDLDKIKTLSNLARVYAQQGENDQAIAYWEQALAITREIDPTHHLHCWVLCLYGSALIKEGRLAQAKQHIQEAVGKLKLFFGKHHPWTLYALCHLGEWYEAKADYVQALSYYTEAVTHFGRIWPPDHPDLLAMQADIKRVEGMLPD